MTSDRPHQQEDVEDEVLIVLEHSNGMSTQEITRLVRAQLPVVAADLAPANARPNEQKIDQIIANALNEGRRLCKAGLIRRIDRGEFCITEAGHAYLANRRQTETEMSAIFDRMFPEDG